MTEDWLQWQLGDSAFPTGGFAHSSGLEAAWQQGEIRNPDELASFLETSLCQFGRSSIPFMTAAHRDPRGLVELDHLCDCFLTNHVANRASRLQGQSLLASCERIFGLKELEQLRPSAPNGLPFGHVAPLFGVILRTLGLEREAAARLFFFIHLRGLISAAVRLGIVGPLQGQSLQRSLAPRAEVILLRCQDLALDEIAQPSPLLELWQANQDRLYSRLFQS